MKYKHKAKALTEMCVCVCVSVCVYESLITKVKQAAGRVDDSLPSEALCNSQRQGLALFKPSTSPIDH